MRSSLVLPLTSRWPSATAASCPLRLYVVPTCSRSAVVRIGRFTAPGIAPRANSISARTSMKCAPLAQQRVELFRADDFGAHAGSWVGWRGCDANRAAPALPAPLAERGYMTIRTLCE
jgi:hypothetical protein